MEKVEKYLLFLVAGFPYRQKMSVPRLIKMLYLADWKNCLVNSIQMSKLEWYYNPDGPYVCEVQNIIQTSSAFSMVQIDSENEETIIFNSTSNIELNQYLDLSHNEKEILNFVIDKTKDLDWQEFNRLVYSTYPLMKQPKYSNLNLEQLSAEYLELKK